MSASRGEGMDREEVSVDGILAVSPFSGGWQIKADDGVQYPLRGRIPGSFRAGDAVSVGGLLRPDLASIDMTGTVLEVQRIEKRPD